MKGPLLIIMIFFISIFFVNGQDIRGGEMEYSYVSLHTYNFNIYLYTQTSIGINHTTIVAYNGDNTSDTLNGTSINLPHDITEWHYAFLHTYPPFTGSYIIYCQDSFLIAGIQNISNSSSEKIFLQTFIMDDLFIGPNSSPVFLNKQTDVSIIANKFIHNPNAYDPDGDSLVFSLDSTFSSTYSAPPGATIDAATGLFQMPVTSGIYAINIRVDEFRMGVRIGVTFREMVIDSSAITGIDVKTEQTFFNIFPNPANDFLTLELQKQISKAEIKVYNFPGELLKNSGTENKTTNIDISELRKGVYIIEVTSGIKTGRQIFIRK